MLLLALLSTVGMAGTSDLTLAAEGTASGLAPDCRTLRTVTATAELGFDYPVAFLNTVDPMKFTVQGVHSECNIALTNVTFLVDGKARFSRRLTLSGTGVAGGSYMTISDTVEMPPLEEFVLLKGEHTYQVILTGLVGKTDEYISVTMDGNLRYWNDFDDDGDLDPRLPGGNDCDDTDPTRNSTLPDYPDGIDNDCDGTRDNDDDEDGLNDAIEVDYQLDPDNPDTDGDGIEDGVEWGEFEMPVDTDEDGRIDARDLDSDDDGYPDQIESDDGEPFDTDDDKIWDFRDTDDDGDGLPSKEELAGDYDGDGLDDYLDPDSDNDGALDGAEGTSDRDGDGLPNHRDTGADLDERRSPEPAGKRGFGLGCNAAPAGTLGLGLLALLIPLYRRRRR